MKKFIYLAPLLLIAGCGRTQLEAPPSAEQIRQKAKAEAQNAKESFSGLSGATLQNSKLEGNDAQGRPIWRLEARNIRSSGEFSGGAPKTATLLDAKATLFQNGQPQSSLSAPKILLFGTPSGVRLQFSQGIRAQSVGVFGGQKIELSAPRGDVDVSKKLVVLSGGATAKQGDFAATSQTLRAFADLARTQMNGGVKAQNASGKMEAQSADYNWKTGRVKAQTVTVTSQNTTLRGEILEADTKARRGTLRGNVRANAPQNRTANAPRLEFDFGRDRIETRDATFVSPDGKGRAALLQTDSKLRISVASGLILEKEGAVLRAKNASGFEKLSRLQGQDIEIVRAGEKLTASRANAQNWQTKQATIIGQNVAVSNASGVARASRATLQNGQISASAGLEIKSKGQTLRADSGQSDLEFQSVTLRGNVRANLPDGAVLRAPLVEKRGEKVVASGGASGVFPSRTDYGSLDFSAKRIETDSQASRVSASGGVQIRARNGARATAPNAVYHRQDQTITATGGVFFSDPARGFSQKGTSLVADLKRREISVKNPQGQVSGTRFKDNELF